MTRFLTSMFLALLAMFISCSASAQLVVTDGSSKPAEITLPDPLTPEAVRQLVATLSDSEVRELLLRRLDAVADENQAQETSGGLLAFAERAAFGPVQSVTDAIARVPSLWTDQSQSFRVFHDRLGWDGIGFMALVMSLAIIAALAIEMLFRRLIRGWQEPVATEGTRSLRQTVIFLFKRLCTDVVAVIIFYHSANFIGPMIGLTLFDLFELDKQKATYIGQYIPGIWFWLIVVPRMTAAVTRFFIAPRRPEFRLVHTDQKSADFLMFHQVAFMVLLGFTIWIVKFNALNGVDVGSSRLGFWLNLALHAYLAWGVWTNREGLRQMMRGAEPDVTRGEAWVAHVYPAFIVGLTVAMWWLVEILASYQLWELLTGWPHMFTILLLGWAPAMDTMIRGLVRHLVPPMSGEGDVAQQAYRATKRSWIRIGRVVVFVAVLWAIARIWGIDYANLAEAGVGAQFAGRFLEILGILAVGYLVWEVVSLWINRKLAAEQSAAGIDLNSEEPGGGEGGGAGGSRLSTVLPLVLGVAKVAIAVLFGLVALSNIGIDTTPLLAGAGIVGLAIGFGAQKLVTDVVSGIFFLVDDAFRTGEYVEVDGTVGTVEKISIRSMQLRHHKGPVHTIPYGEIPKLTNYSRDWVIMKLKFTVPFDTDPNKVKKLFKQIGKDMMAVPEFAEDLLQPFKSQGVFDFDDVGMIIRGKFMAKPGRQFVLRKEIYNRVKKAFEENGIDFARREVRIAIPGLDADSGLTETQKQAVAEGAAQVAQDAIEAQAPPTKT